MILAKSKPFNIGENANHRCELNSPSKHFT
jgi:hypothetical protein